VTQRHGVQDEEDDEDAKRRGKKKRSRYIDDMAAEDRDAEDEEDEEAEVRAANVSTKGIAVIKGPETDSYSWTFLQDSQLQEFARQYPEIMCHTCRC